VSEREDDLGGCSLLTEGSLLKEGVLSLKRVFSPSHFPSSPFLQICACPSIRPPCTHTHTQNMVGKKKRDRRAAKEGL